MLPPSGVPWSTALFASDAQRVPLVSHFPSSQLGAGGLMLHRNVHAMAVRRVLDPSSANWPLPAAARTEACEPGYRAYAVRMRASGICGRSWGALASKGFVHAF